MIDLNDQVWSEIARRSLDEIKGYMLAPYRHGSLFFADDFSNVFGSSLRVDSILDFGCGIGRNFKALESHCKALYGYDIPVMASACRRYFGSGSATISSDWPTISSRNYDITVASFVFQHIRSIDAFRFYIESLSRVTDYFYVCGRHWRDGSGPDNVLEIILDSQCFEVVRCLPGERTVLGANSEQDIHIRTLLRTTNRQLHRRGNQELFEYSFYPIRIPFESYDLLFDRRALADSRGIGRVNRLLLFQLKRLTRPGELNDKKEVAQEVNFFGSIHECPDTIESPSVVMIHDVIPLKYPQQFESAAREWHSRLVNIAHQADYIVTVSESSAADIESHLEIPRSRQAVVPPGITHLPVARQRIVSLPQSPYIVYVGSDDPHKNIDFLLDLLNDPGMSGYSLAVVGQAVSFETCVDRYGLCDRVICYGRLSDGQLGFVVANSHALVLPSHYEGFGLPPFEAALLGVPAICSDRPAMNEVLAGAVELVEPGNIGAWAEACRTLCRDDYRASQVAGIKARAREYTFEASAKALKDIFDKAAKRAPLYENLPERHFHECPGQPHLDARYGCPRLSANVARTRLQVLWHSFVELCEHYGVRPLLMHGSLIGYYFNGRMLPWDNDIDVSFLGDDIATVHTMHEVEIANLRFEVNPNSSRRDSRDRDNIIDARCICTYTGLFVDVTFLTPQADGRLGCKTPHCYSRDQLFPLKEAEFEGARVNVPRDIESILQQEYGKAVCEPRYRSWRFADGSWRKPI